MIDRFVVLEHAWEGVHWDLMLQHGGVLRTWSLDEPLTPGRPIRAQALPDHRAAYLEYEGPVARDRGHVRRVLSGHYCARLWSEDRVLVDLVAEGICGLAELVRDPETAATDTTRWIFRLGKLA